MGKQVKNPHVHLLALRHINESKKAFTWESCFKKKEKNQDSQGTFKFGYGNVKEIVTKRMRVEKI